MDTVRAHVYIEGRVQGVFFRDWTRRQARELGLTGWVRNIEDGRVEAVFEGPKKLLEKMIGKCQEGPPVANVSHIDVVWEKGTGEFSDFEVV